jgi:hypothetical protein
MQPKNHWENVYSTKKTESVSWFQHLEPGSKAAALSAGGYAGLHALVCGVRGQNHAHPEVGFISVNLRGPGYTDTDITITSARGDPVAVSRAQTH